MELYILRHGAAEDRVPGRPDSARALTEEGREKTAAVVKLARRAGVEPSLILSSPYLRAADTAAIAAEILQYKGEVLQSAALVPESAPPTVWSEIRGHRDQAAILVAGHEPLLSRFAAFMLNAPSLEIDMKKSAMVRIDVESLRAAPQGVLRWMITPKLAEK